jgi:phosphomevalonate kinase
MVFCQETDVSLLSVVGTSNQAWNHEVRPFRLPPGMRLMLADVDAGSDTPSLVGTVLRWRKDKSSEGEEDMSFI